MADAANPGKIAEAGQEKELWCCSQFFPGRKGGGIIWLWSRFSLGGSAAEKFEHHESRKLLETKEPIPTEVNGHGNARIITIRVLTLFYVLKVGKLKMIFVLANVYGNSIPYLFSCSACWCLQLLAAGRGLVWFMKCKSPVIKWSRFISTREERQDCSDFSINKLPFPILISFKSSDDNLAAIHSVCSLWSVTLVSKVHFLNKKRWLM